MPDSVPTVYAATRRALHAVAEHVLAAALHDATGRIGLRVTPGGFGTPAFPGAGTERQVRIDGTDIVVNHGVSERRGPLLTVRQAAAFVGNRARCAAVRLHAGDAARSRRSARHRPVGRGRHP